MKKKSKKTKTDTFNAKVDIVTQPDNIKNYSIERKDYTELAMIAIQNKASVIKLIPPSYKDYPILCEEAIKQNAKTFLLVNDNASNYKELGIKSILIHPFIVTGLTKEKKYYLFFWELAISMCYKVLEAIDKEEKELFPLIEKIIQQEPLAIFYVNSKIPTYNRLCNLANDINKESLKYMDINYVDKKLAFEIISKEPEKILYLDNNKEYYKEACKFALSLNGKLIQNMHFPNMEEDIDSFFELINIASKNASEIIDYSVVLYALRLENRKRKEKLLSTPNILGNNLYILLEEIDKEHEMLSKQYIETLSKEIYNSKPVQSDFITHCPIKTKTRNI